MNCLNSKTLTVPIEAPAEAVYEFARNPANLPRWAGAFCLAASETAQGWVLETPMGRMGIRFAEPNPYGVLDHTVTDASGAEFAVSMRVIPNGSGSLVMFTLFQPPGMSDADFLRDQEMVERDLSNLARIFTTFA